MRYDDHTIALTVSGVRRTAQLRSPQIPCPRSAVLLHLAGTADDALNNPSFCMTADIFLAAGHHVISFDLPCHGERINDVDGAVEVAGWAAAAAAGVDLFAEIRHTGTAVLDYIANSSLTPHDCIVASGISRGAYSAYQIMANDQRVLAAAGYAPCTYLPAVDLFAEFADNPIIVANNTDKLVPKLANRPVFVGIGETDPRVDADRCFAFFGQLSAVSHCVQPTLFTVRAQSHHEDFPGCVYYQAGAAFLLELCASAMSV